MNLKTKMDISVGNLDEQSRDQSGYGYSNNDNKLSNVEESAFRKESLIFQAKNKFALENWRNSNQMTKIGPD